MRRPPAIKKSFISLLFLALVSLVLLAGQGETQVTVGKSWFDQGRTRLSLYGGWGTAFNQDYFLIGAGLGYYIARGLELGVDGESWVGNSPKINKISPEARYIFQPLGATWYPYLGAFYRRTFYEDLEDANSVGGRLGVYAPVGGHAYFGVGGVFERQLDCNTDIYSHCSVFYPEFAISVGF